MKNDVKSCFHEMVQHDHFIPAQNDMFFMFDLRLGIDLRIYPSREFLWYDSIL